MDERTIEKIQEIRNQFFTRVQPEFVFSLHDVPQFQVDRSLVDPSKHLPQTHKYPFAQMQYLYNGIKTCGFPPTLPFLHRDLGKAVYWQQFLCGQVKSLPEKFFRIRPFLHPLGSSYVLLAMNSEHREFKSAAFIKKYKDFLHLEELLELEPPASLRPSQRVLASFEPEHLSAFLSSEPLLLSKSYLLYKLDQPDDKTFPRYAVYPREAWDNYLEKTGFQAKVNHGGFHIYLEGNVSWNVNRDYLEFQSGRYKVLAGFSALMLALNVIWLIFLEIRRRVQQQEERLFILQTLTHELRTPVASMQLNLEPFRKDFDHLSQDGQRAFLRMADGVRRLNKVISASTQYLKSSQDDENMRFHLEYFPDLNEVLEFLLEDYHGRVEFLRGEQEIGVKTDAYWLGMCLKNLVENALKHGVPPVQVKVVDKGNTVGIQVIDQGQVSEQEFRMFLNPFSRKSKEEGLGLGLTLVKRIVDQMGANLNFKAKPTIFEMEMEKWHE